MLRFVLLFNLILCPLVISKRKASSESGDDLGGNLVSALRNDVNLDLSMDEEYEDLRAELLAYHTALASLTTGRRSMKTTPCWTLGGICIEHKMCIGHRFLTEVAGCKNNLEVCCFAWNKFQVRDMRDEGISVVAMPWSTQTEYGGKGVIGPQSNEDSFNHAKHTKHEHGGDTHLDNPAHSNSHHDNKHPPHSPHSAHNSHNAHENPPVVVILRGKK